MSSLYPPTETNLGSLCHFRPGAFPVAAITDLGGEIIVSNAQYESQSRAPLWVIHSLKVVTTRFWACSQATITLACAVNDIDQLPPPLPPFFRIEQDLCIHLGYLEQMRPIHKGDLGFRLLRVFIGVIDTFSRTITDTGGILVKIQCRDRMKWLMDTTVTLSPQNEGSNIASLGLGLGSVDSKNEIARSDLIIDIARRGIGHVEYSGPAANSNVANTPQINTSCLTCGRRIMRSSAFIYDAGLSSQHRPIDVWYREQGAPLQAKTRTDVQRIDADPEFRIYTARQKIRLRKNLQFLITQKVPIEIIKVLALQEVNPTEVFQSHVDGHFYYVPRTCDISSLTDAKRFYRTYYVRNVPPSTQLLLEPKVDAAPNAGSAQERAQGMQEAMRSIEREPFKGTGAVDFNQMVLRYKDELTSVGLKTNIQLRVMNDVNQSQQMAYAVHLRAYPWDLKKLDEYGRKPAFACKVLSWEDDTIENLAEAAVVALNLARQYSREVRAATGILLGDPSLTPGEVCQVVAPPLFETENWLEKLQNDRRQFFVFHQRNLTYAQDYEAKVRDFKGGDELTLPIYDATEGLFKVDREANKNEKAFLCRDSSKVWDKKEIGFNEDPRSIWRVEAVIHNFNVGAQGYRTEVAWVSPF